MVLTYGHGSMGIQEQSERTVDSDAAEPIAVRGPVKFGDYAIDPDLFELRKNGEPVPVEPLVFNLLAFLAANHERTVTRDEVFAEIWSGRIVSDAALSSQIKAARKAVGDDGASQHTIRTVHGRGFRFVAPIEEATPDGAAISTPSQIAPCMPDNVSGKPAVAVLPFANLSGDTSEDYFADGVTEDITTALAKNRWLIVIARNSAFAFRDSNKGTRQIGKELSADYIVTGSIRKAGTRARISVEVVDTATVNSVWSERFDRDIIDIFELQDDITETVAARLEAELGISEQRKAERRPRKNMGAWDLYQLGVAQFYKFTPESNTEAQNLLHRSIKLDPEFAPAYSRLAYAIVLSMVYFDAPTDQKQLDEALAAAKKAIELDDQDSNGYFSIGRVYLARREYDLAIESLEQALQLNPCLAVTYCGLGDALAYGGHLEEAIEQFDTAIKLSPHDPFRWAFFSYRSMAHLFRGEYADASAWARKSIQIPNAQYWAYAHLVAALGHLGDTERVGAAIEQLLDVKPEFTVDFAKERLFYLTQESQIDTYLEGLRKAGLP